MPEPYPTPGGVENAIKDAAKKAAALDPSLDVTRRIRLEYFDRFLSRVFSDGEDSEWVLKGGTGILARVPSTRATRDIDLFHAGFSLAEALKDLRRLAAVDLGDHFRFDYIGHTDSIATATQPYTEGYQIRFGVLVGFSGRGSMHVDLAVGAGITGDVVTLEPASRLALPRLSHSPYRLYPVVDQIADKVCATVTERQDRPSSREKDLVDLVVFATTQAIEGTTLRLALMIESRRRRMLPISHFDVPSGWGPGYRRLSRPVPYCQPFKSVNEAAALVASLIDPALRGDADGRTWSPDTLSWS